MWKGLNKQRRIFVQTWDCELRSCTVFDSSTVVGNTAVHPTILRAYSSYLQHTRGQQSIPVQWQTDRLTVRGRHLHWAHPFNCHCVEECVFTVIPVIRGIHGPPVSFPADDRLRQAMDLALKPSNTSQLCTYRTWLHMKICHCWRQKRKREIALTL